MNTQALLSRMLGRTFTPPPIVAYTQPDQTNKNTGRTKMATRAYVGDTMHVGK